MARILVIDDDAQTRKALRHVLEGARHDVVEAQNGRVGMSLYKEKPANLVISDIIMPEVDGIETITALRKHDPNVKIVAISGADRTYLRAVEKLGASRILAKPFGKSELLEVVREVLEV
jgi:DNA-binding NtrC family response regulator